MIGKNMWCFWTLHIRIVKVRRNTVAPFLYILTVFLKICYWPKIWVGMEREINLCLRIAESSDFCRGRSTRNSWCWVKVKKTYQTTHITQNIWRAVVTLDRAPETWVTFGAFIIHLIDLLFTKGGKKYPFWQKKKNPFYSLMSYLYFYLRNMVKSFFTLREMAIFTLRVWVWILPVLRQPSSVQPLSGLRGWTLSLCNSAFAEAIFYRRRKAYVSLPEETWCLAESSTGSPEMTKLYKENAYTLWCSFSFTVNCCILESKPTGLQR